MLKLSLMLSMALALSTGVANAALLDIGILNNNNDRVIDRSFTYPAVMDRSLTYPAVVGGSGCCGTSTVLTQPAVVEPISTCGVLEQPAVIDSCGTRVLHQSAVIAPQTFMVPAPRLERRDRDGGLFGILNPLNWFD